MRKLQISLTKEETDLIAAKAAQVGYDLTRYIKFIIGREAMEMLEGELVPIFKMSKKAERRAREGRKEYEAGKTKGINSLAELVK